MAPITVIPWAFGVNGLIFDMSLNLEIVALGAKSENKNVTKYDINVKYWGFEITEISYFNSYFNIWSVCRVVS